MTIIELDKTPEGNQPIVDPRGCGRTVELVGTGKTEAVDLTRVYMTTCVKGFWWQEVDLSIGAVEIFNGNRSRIVKTQAYHRQTIFLSEWAPGVIYSFNF